MQRYIQVICHLMCNGGGTDPCGCGENSEGKKTLGGTFCKGPVKR